MQIVESLEAVHTHTHGYFSKINIIVHKISIMLFSNVLFLCIYKYTTKVLYC